MHWTSVPYGSFLYFFKNLTHRIVGKWGIRFLLILIQESNPQNLRLLIQAPRLKYGPVPSQSSAPVNPKP